MFRKREVDSFYLVYDSEAQVGAIKSALEKNRLVKQTDFLTGIDEVYCMATRQPWIQLHLRGGTPINLFARDCRPLPKESFREGNSVDYLQVLNPNIPRISPESPLHYLIAAVKVNGLMYYESAGFDISLYRRHSLEF